MIYIGEYALTEAILLATTAHNYQHDKKGMPYIYHPLRVMLAVKDYGYVYAIAGVLHDVVEDTPIQNFEIREKFGDVVADAVNALTKVKGEPYTSLICRALANPYARIVKIADINDNLGRMIPEMEWAIPRYKAALAVLQRGE